MKTRSSGSIFGFACFLILIGVSTLQKAYGASDADLTDLWSGEYFEASTLCTEPGSGRSCSEKYRDSLKIKKSPVGYFVSLYSIQAGQHVCSFDLNMEVGAGWLIYKSGHGSFFIERHMGVLRISSNNVDPTALGLGV